VAPERRQNMIGVLARVVAIKLSEHSPSAIYVVKQRGGAGAVVLDEVCAADRRVELSSLKLRQDAEERARHEIRRCDPRDTAGEIIAGRLLLGKKLFCGH